MPELRQRLRYLRAILTAYHHPPRDRIAKALKVLDTLGVRGPGPVPKLEKEA